MVAGHLSIKKNYYYIVLSYTKDGKRKTKWIATGLGIRNNKKRAEILLSEARNTFDVVTETLLSTNTNPKLPELANPYLVEMEANPTVLPMPEFMSFGQQILDDAKAKFREIDNNINFTEDDKREEAGKVKREFFNQAKEVLVHLIEFTKQQNYVSGTEYPPDAPFACYMLYWLGHMRGKIEETSYAGYSQTIKGIIAPYFALLDISLIDLRKTHIEDFYDFMSYTVKANSIKHYHANIRKALQYAFKNNMVSINEADKVELPLIIPFEGSYYTLEELNALFKAVENTEVEFPVLVAAYYGLRKSEILGLKWSNIDFEYNQIRIKHTVVGVSIDHKYQLIKKDRTKSKRSNRPLPLVGPFRELLLRMKAIQEYHAKICGKGYHLENKDYLCVDPMGRLLDPSRLTEKFKRILEKNNLRPIRFHDLRHSAATLLKHEGVPLEDISEYLGHSDTKITEKIYAHFLYEKNEQTGNIIAKAFGADRILMPKLGKEIELPEQSRKDEESFEM